MRWLQQSMLMVFLSCGCVLPTFGDEQDGGGSTAVGVPASADLVYVRYLQDQSDLYSLRLSDGRITPVTQTETAEEYPVWSPDGSFILMLARQGETFSIDAIETETGARDTLLENASEPASWSTDARSIVVTRDSGDSRGLVIVTLADGQESQVLTGSDADAYATWSPVENRLVFESSRDGSPEIYAVNTDGSMLKRLTNNVHLDEWPQWSNDGQFIAFASGEEGDKNLWVMRADGSGKRQLTRNVLFGDAYPSWSPDDRHIVITAQTSESETMLLLVNVESGATKELIPGMAAVWRPRPASE